MSIKPLFVCIFVALLLFIGFVEVYDIYWSIKLQETLYNNELNPIGKWLIELDDGSVALFMAVKTTLCIILMVGLIFLAMVKKWILFYFFLILAFLTKLSLLLYLEFGHLL
jgi:hypothetical protein